MKCDSLKVKSTDRKGEGKVLKKGSTHKRTFREPQTKRAPNVIPSNVDFSGLSSLTHIENYPELCHLAIIWKKGSAPLVHLITYTADFYT